jgi:hypothetical protein
MLPNISKGHHIASLNSNTDWKVAGSIPDEVTGFFNWPNASSRTMALWSTQLLTEISTNNVPGVMSGRRVKADLIAFCEPTLQKMWEPQRLTAL